MVDCACANFPSSLGNVTIGASLGVGTLTPAKKLHIQSTAPNSQVYLSDRSPAVEFGNLATGPGGTMNAVLALATAAGDFALAAGDVRLSTYGSARGHLYIDANYQGAAPDRSVVLQPYAGNVGVGTEMVAPASRLVVRSTDDEQATTIFQTQSGNRTVGVGIGQDAIRLVSVPEHPNYALSIDAKGSGNLRLQNAPGVTGNVGIGTDGAAAKLDVSTAPRSPGYPTGLTAFISGILQANSGIRFAHVNGSQAIDFGHNGLQKFSNNGYNDLTVDGYLTGHVLLQTVATGNVGIGTAMPQAKLHVQGGRTRLRGTDQITLVLDPPPTGDTNTSAVQFNDSAGNPRWQLVSGLGNAPGNFALVNVGGGDATPLYVNAAGNVGIGVTQPTQKLSVQGGVRLGDSSTEAGVPNALMIRRAGGDSVNYVTMINEGTVTGTISSGGSGRRRDLVFGNDAGGNYIFSTGNVGIGTTTPGSKLAVDGPATGQGYTADFSGDLRVGGVIDCVGNIAIQGSGRAYYAGSTKIADSAGCYYA